MNVLLLIPVLAFIAAISEAANNPGAAMKNENLADLPTTLAALNGTQEKIDTSEPVVLNRGQRACSVSNLNSLKSRISIALERQIEKMMKDDYVDNHTESTSCTRYTGVTMNYPIRLFLRSTVENVIYDYKLESLRP